MLEKKETIALRDKHISNVCQLFFRSNPLKIVKANGQYMFDEENNRYLDCVNNVCHVGHSHPDVVKAAHEQMCILNTNSRFLHDNIVLLAKRLTDTLPDPLSICFFVNSGSEANDLAIRLAKCHTKHTDAIVLENAYHGHTEAVHDISPYKKKLVDPDWVHIAPTPDRYRGMFTSDNYSDDDISALYAAEVKNKINEAHGQGKSIAAFFAESLQSCGGQIILPPNYLKTVYHLIREAGGICVADEVQCGFGRVGKHFWGFQLQGEDTVPDIVTIGKPMGNGHPVAAVITTKEIADSFKNTGVEYFNTYGGNPVSCAVALKVLDVIQNENLQQNSLVIGDYLLEKFLNMKISHPLIGDVRGTGLFVGIELVKNRKTKEPAADEAQYVISKLRDQHVLVTVDGPRINVLKLKPPLCFNKENADEVTEKIDKILYEIETVLETPRISEGDLLQEI